MCAEAMNEQEHVVMLLGVCQQIQRFVSAVDALRASGAAVKEDPSDPLNIAASLAPGVMPGAAMHRYLVWIDQHLRPSPECYVMALVLLNRCGAPFGSRDAVWFLAAAIVLSIKLRDDRYYSNSVYAEVMGLRLADLNSLERALLHRLDWNVEVSPHEYAAMLASCFEEVRVSHCLVDVLPPMPTVFTITRGSAEESFGLLLKDTRVVGAVPRTASHNAGVRHNMVVRSVNGTLVSTHAGVIEALRQSGLTAVVEVFQTSLQQMSCEVQLGMAAPMQQQLVALQQQQQQMQMQNYLPAAAPAAHNGGYIHRPYAVVPQPNPCVSCAA